MIRSDQQDPEQGVRRRTVLKCMTWAGTGVLWTIAGGVPRSLGILNEAVGAEQKHGLTFLQLSDSHVGFNKPANPNALGTLEEAIAKVKASSRLKRIPRASREAAICSRRASSRLAPV